MHHSDHFLITEAWRKVEQFQWEALRDQLLTLYREAKPGSWRYAVAQFLVDLALRLDPRLEPSLRPPTQAQACSKGL